MVRNYFTLRAIARELDALLRGHTIAELFTQEKETLAIRFVDLRETLIVSCKTNLALLYFHPAYHRARTNTADICPACWDLTIDAVSIHPSDRIVSLHLEGGAGLHARLFGANANVMLTDAEGRIADAFKHPRSLIGTIYTLPTTSPPFDKGLFASGLRDSPDAQVGAVLKRLLPAHGSLLVAEIIHRAGVRSHLTTSQLSDRDIEKITAAVLSLQEELEDPHPVIYTFAATASHGADSLVTRTFSLVPLHHIYPSDSTRFESVQQGVRAFVAGQDRTERLRRAKEQLLSPLQQLVERTSRTLGAMEQEAHDHNRAAQWERCGSLLMSHLPRLSKGMQTVDLLDGAETTSITLDPSLAPADNARRYFEKAKRARAAQQKNRERIRRVNATLAQAQEVIAAVSSIDTIEGLKTYMKNHGKELDMLGAGKRGRDRAALPFRIFTVDGGFQVLAGKSNINNDLLTTKHAKPRDLWFHARGVSGSHVVLKIDSGHGEPSKRAREQAASIAAYYSKMRNAKLVPVAVAERKHVRKPKGAPPGTVVLEREQVIFAQPALPSQEEE